VSAKFKLDQRCIAVSSGGWRAWEERCIGCGNDKTVQRSANWSSSVAWSNITRWHRVCRRFHCLHTTSDQQVTASVDVWRHGQLLLLLLAGFTSRRQWTGWCVVH